MNRSIAKILTIVISVAVVLPVGQNFSSDPVDSFPLSYYPMFSKERGKTIDMIYIAGFDRNGQESRQYRLHRQK